MNSKIEKTIFINLPIAFTSLIPALLITGPFLPDLAISVCAIIFLINTFKNNLYSYYKNNFFYFFIIFCAWIVMSSILSKNMLLSFESSLFYFRFGIFSLSTWYLLDQNEHKLIKYTYLVILFCFLSLVLDGFYQFYFHKNILGFPLVDHRISSFFGKEWILGSYLSRFYPIFFALFIFLKKKNIVFANHFLVAIILILSEMLIYLSGERTSFFYLNLGAFFLLVQLKEFRLFRLITLTVSVIFLIFISINASEFKARMIDTTTEQLNNTLSKDKIVIFSHQHQIVYEAAYKMFIDNKIIGIGPKNFRVRCQESRYFKKDLERSVSSCETHPHNTYLQLLTETGLVGFGFVIIVFLIIVFCCFKHFFMKFFQRNIFFSDIQLCLILSIIISLWPFVPTGNFFGNWLAIIYYFPVGFLIFFLKKTKD